MPLSLDQIRQMLSMQASERFGDEYYVHELYEDSVIICSCADMTYWRMAYTKDDVSVKLGDERQKVVPMVDYMPIAESATLREASDGEGWVWEVLMIAPGLSKNGNLYSEAALREAAPKFEGVRALARSDRAHSTDQDKSVDKIVGWFDGVRYQEGQGIVGNFTITRDANWLREKMLSGYERGKTDLVQFSIVASGTGKRQLQDGKVVTVVESITHAEFVDTVVDAAAGGRVLKLVASATEQKGTAMLEQLLRLLESQRPELYAKVDKDNVTEDQVLALLKEATTPVATQQAPSVDLREAEARIARMEAKLALKEAMLDAELPSAAKEKLTGQLSAHIDAGVTVNVAEAIAQEKAYLQKLVGDNGAIKGFGADVKVTESHEDKVIKAFDDFFERKTHSFKECYVQLTGDSRVTGRVAEAKNLGAYGNLRLSEAMTSSTLDQILGDSIRRAMVREYERMGLNQWRSVADVVPVQDFRTNRRTRMGGYANLSTVAEAAAYAALTSPSDEEATYAVVKRGGTETITLEMIKNDDAGAIRMIPVRMGRAAAQTLLEFVFGLITANPTIYDSVALFHASHGNLNTVAFSAAEFMVHRQKMRDQAEAGSSKPLGLTPGVLIVPNELEEATYNAFRQDTNLEPRLVATQQIRPEIIVLDYLTDANNWYTVCRKGSAPTIEVGFLDGREEPEVFVADNPEVGSMFTNDQRVYKIRHVYSGAILDYRGFQGAIVP